MINLRFPHCGVAALAQSGIHNGPVPPARKEVLHLFRCYTHTRTHTHARQELDHCRDPSGTDPDNMQLNKAFRGGLLGLVPYRKIKLLRWPMPSKCPWAPCKSRSFTSVQMLHAHTHGRSRVNPERQEEEKSGHQRRANGQNSAEGGREQTNLKNQPTRRNGPNQHRAHT